MTYEPITLYGTPLSLYTGKARSYLIKNGLAYREVTPTTSRFLQHVAPRAGGIARVGGLERPRARGTAPCGARARQGVGTGVPVVSLGRAPTPTAR